MRAGRHICHNINSTNLSASLLGLPARKPLAEQVTQLKEELMTHLRSQTQLDLPAPAAGA